jgi:hypothetical protein
MQQVPIGIHLGVLPTISCKLLHTIPTRITDRRAILAITKSLWRGYEHPLAIQATSRTRWYAAVRRPSLRSVSSWPFFRNRPLARKKNMRSSLPSSHQLPLTLDFLVDSNVPAARPPGGPSEPGLRRREAPAAHRASLARRARMISDGFSTSLVQRVRRTESSAHRIHRLVA